MRTKLINKLIINYLSATLFQFSQTSLDNSEGSTYLCYWYHVIGGTTGRAFDLVTYSLNIPNVTIHL